MLIGKNKKSFIFAFQAKVKLETMSNSDLFATALASPFNSNFQYLMMSDQGYL